MDKTSIKRDIIMYLEAEGHASKSKIEDYLKETKGTTGDCVSRRLRELVSSGVISKTQLEYQGKKYYDYKVVEERPEYLQDMDDPNVYIPINWEKSEIVEQTEKLNL